MSLMSMRRKMASKQTAIILWVLIVVFIAGIALISIPAGMRGGGGGSIAAGAKRDATVIATVGGDSVTRGELDIAFEQKMADNERYASMMGGSGGDQFAKISKARKEALTEVIQKHLLNQSLKKFGIKMSDGLYHKIAKVDAQAYLDSEKKSAESQVKQMADEAAKSTATVKPPVKTTEQVLGESMSRMMSQGQEVAPGKKNPSESEFIRWYVSMMFDAKDGQDESFKFDASLRTLGEYMGTKFATEMGAMDPFSEAYVKKINTEEVKASWIFIPAEKADAASLGEAKKKADDLYAKVIADPKSFGENAKASSKDINSMDANGVWGKDGWLNQTSKRMEQSTFPALAEYLAYALKPGEISPVTLMTFYSQQDAKDRFSKGFYVGYAFVKVDDNSRPWEEKKTLDWNLEKNALMYQSKSGIARDLARGYLEAIRYQTPVVAKDDEVAYWMADIEMEVIKANELLPKAYEMRSKLPKQVQSVLAYNMSYMPQSMPITPGNQDDATREAAQKKMLADKAKYLEEALPDSGDQAPELYLQIGRIYSFLKKNDDAIRCFTNAYQSDNKTKKLHEDLRVEFDKLGDSKNVEKMDKWLLEHKDDKPEQPGGFDPSMMNFGQ